ncbi:FtsB family cell division protein [Miniphocaeibacter halophilus]|uniref:Septum formation initiator family protein n=1 Tax=Miniphocaeibacter halophilus TaxID=2931922 RepID=A0AC61MUS3_9FIRM|nr:septum formation initiator family protein [Miniphocaeibacter halophilus]QQK07939.1 septum formation initiator family protein [Miniphocaeibacter halophilus]
MERKTYKKEIRKRKQSNRRFVSFIVVLAIISSLYFTFTFIRQIGDYNRINKELDTLVSEKESLKDEIKELENTYKEVDTPEFVEKMAREKLGMVKSDEYIVKYKTKKSNE